MAPRAGFELQRKSLSEQVVQTFERAGYPQRHPTHTCAAFWGVRAIACDTGSRLKWSRCIDRNW